MRQIIASIFAFISALALVVNASAQTVESIWLTANTAAYKTGETVIVALSASSTTPVQGFTFQIRYDPSCLQPVNASSPIPGMNGLPLPQIDGLADGSYASTTPQAVNGVLAEIRFTALKGCQTALYLESAALAVRNAEGFAVPLSGVSIAERNISLSVDNEVGKSQSSQPEGSILPLNPPKAEQGNLWWVLGGGIAILFVILAGLLVFGLYRRFTTSTAYKEPLTRPSLGRQKATLHIKHGPQAGRSFTLNEFPILIGRDPRSDIYINDPNIINYHAQIISEKDGYYLRDLGGGTFINGHRVKSKTVVLKPGDIVRLGRSVSLVLG